MSKQKNKPRKGILRGKKYWSQEVTKHSDALDLEPGVFTWKNPKKIAKSLNKHSNALDLEPGVFTWKNPKKIAKSLKNSAEMSTRRKAGPFQSAMSMLNFYINRAGKNLPAEQKKILEQAKIELRKQFDRE